MWRINMWGMFSRERLLKYLVGFVVLIGLRISLSNIYYLNDAETQVLHVPNHAMPRIQVGEEMHQPKVFVVSMPRSGSTFMLEIFNNHPDFLGLFETTKWMRKHSHCDMNTFARKTAQSPEAQWFRDIYACNFSTYEPKLGQWGATKSGNKSTCIPGNPPSKVVVVKEIWPWGMRLDWVNKIIGEDLRVVALSRDVRGFVSSFVYVPVYNITVMPTASPLSSDKTELKPYNVTKKRQPMYHTWHLDRVDIWSYFCLEGIEVPEFLRPRMKFIKRVLQDKYAAPHLRMASVWTLMTAVTEMLLQRHLKGRYISVSHTELSVKPHAIVDSMFSFLGAGKAPRSVHEFMDSHTREGNYTVRHSTARNSTEASVIYLSRLTRTQLEEIETIAHGVMEPLGFVPLFQAKVELSPSKYERVAKGKNKPLPPMPVFSWEIGHEEKPIASEEQESSDEEVSEEIIEGSD